MEIGLTIPHTGPQAASGHIRAVCEAAESAGLDCLWAVDHLVLPHHTTSPYPLGRTPATLEDGALVRQLAPNFELIATLSWVAGFTSRIGLGTSVAVLPLRGPIVNARQIATLDALSGGRFILGISPGALPSDAEVLGILGEDRNKMFAEAIDVILQIWQREPPSAATTNPATIAV